MPMPSENKSVLDSEDPLGRETLFQKIKRNRYFAVAILIHIIILAIFGGRVWFESIPKNSLQSTVLIAPRPDEPKDKPIQEVESSEPSYNVKTPTPAVKPKTIISNNKLSNNFNVPAPDVSDVISGTSIGGGPGGGKGKSNGPGGDGFENINFGEAAQKAVRVIYCVDVSRSMISDGRAFKVVETELQNEMRRLNETNEFNIITFAKIGEVYKDKMTPSSAQETSTALQWFHKQSPDSFKDRNWEKDKLYDEEDFHLGSHPHMALEKAFEQNPAMIVLLHDGNPTDISRQEVLDKINELESKLTKKVAVHTVLFQTASEGEENGRAKMFMNTVATNTGGIFKIVKDEKKSADAGM
jgi:hypothetical protein